MMTATLILTHKNPDLDAIGFAYSTRKVFGSAVPMKCGTPTREDLEDPAVIVGDIGVLGCEELGHSPEHNNFDHHYSHAERSAVFLFNQKYRALRADIVEYIDAVDTRWLQETTDLTLKVATTGIRVRCLGYDLKVLEKGSVLLRWLEETGQDPGDLREPFPPAIQVMLQSGRDEMQRIRQELGGLKCLTTASGRSIGYVVTSSPVFSVVKEETFTRGVDIAVAHSLEKKRFSIACNFQRLKEVNLKEGGLIAALTAAEHARGLPLDQGWGGHPDRIGSPRRAGSSLSAEEVLELVKIHL
jgi:nanoRNase/pAp phosphatase (c-di-AMP/oligoRNAs hydrolase)